MDEIDGPGVIGQYPVLKPGKMHTYASRSVKILKEYYWKEVFIYLAPSADDGAPERRPTKSVALFNSPGALSFAERAKQTDCILS